MNLECVVSKADSLLRKNTSLPPAQLAELLPDEVNSIAQEAVLHEMIYGEFQHCYDPALLQIFAGGLQPLPIGAKLKLNTGQSGVVVQHNLQNVFQPQIMIAFDKGNSPLPKSMLSPPFYVPERERMFKSSRLEN